MKNSKSLPTGGQANIEIENLTAIGLSGYQVVDIRISGYQA
jgi:hypothetical protein